MIRLYKRLRARIADLIPTGGKCRAAIAAAVLCSISPRPSLAQQIELELILALDASSSVEREEFDLQVQGLAQAFESPQVLQALDAITGRGVAISVVQWSSPSRQHVALPWTLVPDRRMAAQFAQKLRIMPRYIGSGGTATGQAITFAQRHFQNNAYTGARRVIDVSGDGRANMGRLPAHARREAVAAGITINGLAILNEEAHVDRYYAENVIGGPGAFLMTAQDYATFGDAIRRKLIREITGTAIVQRVRPPDDLSREAQFAADYGGKSNFFSIP